MYFALYLSFLPPILSTLAELQKLTFAIMHNNYIPYRAALRTRAVWFHIVHNSENNYFLISKKTKVLINVPLPQQTREDSDSTHKTVEEDRKLQIQVCFYF